MLHMMAARECAQRKAREDNLVLKNHQAVGARRNSLWRRDALTEKEDCAKQRGATASEAIRDRLDRIYEDYYNFIPEDRDDIVPAREDGDDSAPARKLVPQSVTIGGENFGEAVAKVTRTMTVKLKPMLSLFSQHSKVSNYDDEDFVHQDGHLPIWVIARLRVKLKRARHAIMARNELVRPKHAIKPEGRPKTAWDLLTTLLLVYTLFEIPLEIAFMEAGCDMSSLDWFNFFVDIIFCADILVAFHTGFVVKINGEDILQDDHCLIAERYLRGWFFVDLISSIPLERFVCLAIDTSSTSTDNDSGMTVLRVFKVARFLKLARLIRFNRMLNKWQAMSVKKWQLNFTRLFKLVIMLLMVAHFMGCGWMLVADGQDCGVWVDPEKHGNFSAEDLDKRYGCECPASILGDQVCEPVNWLSKYDEQLAKNGDIGQKYVTSAYFTIIGLSTVGFGDINPANDYERLFSIILTLGGALVFAIVIGSVSEIAQQRNHFEVALSDTVHMISDFLEHRNVPEDISNRIIKHITFSSQRAPHLYTPDQLHLLPASLRQSLMNHLVNEQLGTIVQTFPLFLNMDPELRVNFLLLLRPVMLLDEEYLYEALEVAREAYILTTGTLELWVYENQFGHMAKSDERIKDHGEIVGETALLDDGPPFRYNSIRSYGRCELLELTKEDFDRHVRFDYPDVYKCFQEMARARLTAPGGKEALMAMRSRSIRRCAIIKQKTRKDPLTGKPLFGEDEQTVFEEKDKDKSNQKDRNSKDKDVHNSSLRSLPSAQPKQNSALEPLQMPQVPSSEISNAGLEARMDKLEEAMSNLTDLVITMNQKLDQGATSAPRGPDNGLVASSRFFP